MIKKVDLTGKVIGNLTVIEEINVQYNGIEKNRKTLIKLKCMCKCGKIFFPYKTNVLSKKTTKCSLCSLSLNLLGKKIGKITVFKINHETKNGRHYDCICECGAVFTQKQNSLRRSKGVRCKYCPKISIPKLTKEEAHKIVGLKKHEKSKKELIGKKFGRLTVLKFHEWEYKNNRRYAIYMCKCECKKIKFLRSYNVYAVKSCGCLRKEAIPKGENNARAKLRNSDVYSIRELIKTKMYTQKQIANMYGVTETSISKIKLQENYKI